MPDVTAAAEGPLEPRSDRCDDRLTLERLDIARSYPRLADFRALAERFDPTGVFRNPFLARTIGR
jgi:alditol oxidase